MTLLTLARDLGVSRATVSNAYNRPDQLSAALRERILARAAELGFAGPDPAARGLRRGRVGAVGVLVDQSLSYAFSDPAAVLLLDGLARDLQQDGLGLLLHAAPSSASDLAPIRDAAVDGWVVQSLPAGHPAVAAVQARGRPLVVVDQPVLRGVPTVAVDDEAGAAELTRHLLGLGHRRLGVVCMPLRPDGRAGRVDAARLRGATYEVMRRRLLGVRAAVQAAGLAWADVPVVECVSNDPDAGAAAAVALGVHLATEPTSAPPSEPTRAGTRDGTRAGTRAGAPEPVRPTAVLALSDQLAVGVLRAARDARLAVPAQLSVAGFDDAPPAATADPPLTTVAQPLLERGRAVGGLLRALLAGERVASPPPYPVRLVVRESTGPVPPA